MLVGISPLISPDLLAALSRMGHGDQIILADAHFPGESLGPSVIRADGLMIPDLLDGILPLFPTDPYTEESVLMMAPVEGDQADPSVETGYWNQITKHWPETPPLQKVERFRFYDLAKGAFCVVMTGDTAKYGNLILTKGLVQS
ncbi:MAG: L-fucose mutarotase [Verrucomicrobiota bacterium]